MRMLTKMIGGWIEKSTSNLHRQKVVVLLDMGIMWRCKNRIPRPRNLKSILSFQGRVSLPIYFTFNGDTLWQKDVVWLSRLFQCCIWLLLGLKCFFFFLLRWLLSDFWWFSCVIILSILWQQWDFQCSSHSCFSRVLLITTKLQCNYFRTSTLKHDETIETKISDTELVVSY